MLGKLEGCYLMVGDVIGDEAVLNISIFDFKKAGVECFVVGSVPFRVGFF